MSDRRPEKLWANWPWNRCPAVAVVFGRARRCDLRKGHKRGHVSNQAFDVFEWEECWFASDEARSRHAAR